MRGCCNRALLLLQFPEGLRCRAVGPQSYWATSFINPSMGLPASSDVGCLFAGMIAADARRTRA